MSAWDVAGAVVWTPLALLYLVAAIIPAEPPRPRYGWREVGCLAAGLTCGGDAIYFIIRCFGAHA